MLKFFLCNWLTSVDQIKNVLRSIQVYSLSIRFKAHFKLSIFLEKKICADMMHTVYTSPNHVLGIVICRLFIRL